MKLLTVVGARPQFVKAGTVSRELTKHSGVHEILVHTGQHFDSNMSDIFFEQMQIKKPDYNLGIGGRSHGAMTGQIMEKIEEILLSEKPDCVIVYGDTNSTLAGALAAVKLQIKIAHIEAGLRSHNMAMPEEINRIVTDRVSNVLFCPTEAAMNNLKLEGYYDFDCQVVNSGDVMLDGAQYYEQFAQRPKFERIMPEFEYRDFVLCTLHRAENTDDLVKIREVFDALNVVASQSPIILPLHPRTRAKIQECNIQLSSAIHVVDPVGYFEMIWLIKNCKVIMTDSGGLQKEAFFFSKPCITMREETEWLELVENGFNELTGTSRDKILNAFRHVDRVEKKSFDVNLYGDGTASKSIVSTILSMN